MNDKNSNQLLRDQQEQLLKLVTKSFYKELVNYGVESSDIVTVSLHLLDHVTQKTKDGSQENDYYSNQFHRRDVVNLWDDKKEIYLGKVGIRILSPPEVPTVCEWLNQKQVKKTFIEFLPKDPAHLKTYFFEIEDRQYFGIYYKDELVGIIGADNLDTQHKKLEMKKFIGAFKYSGKGIGKRATFLFLYYSFMILNFNKVYIHSLDTNIRNINLNSKFGFELEGIFFQDVLKSNEVYDVVRMGLLRNRWIHIFNS